MEKLTQMIVILPRVEVQDTTRQNIELLCYKFPRRLISCGCDINWIM